MSFLLVAPGHLLLYLEFKIQPKTSHLSVLLLQGLLDVVSKFSGYIYL